MDEVQRPPSQTVGDFDGPVVLLPRVFDRSTVHLPSLLVAVGVGALGLVGLTLDAVSPGASPLEAGGILAVALLVTFRRRRRLAVTGALVVLVVAGASLMIDVGRTTDVEQFAIGMGALNVLVGGALLRRAWVGRRDAGSEGAVELGLVLVAVGGLVIASPLQGLFLLQQVAAFSLLVVAGAFLVRAGSGADPTRADIGTWFRDQAQSWQDRAELVERLSFEGEDERTRLARFLALMAFASVLAALGVIVDSTAIVIGAMLVAPLMTPLMGASLSLAVGWPRRATRAALVALVGALLSVGIGMVVGAMIPLPLGLASNPQVVSRTAPSLIDLIVALAAGGAGAFALARRDVADALPGVAIAIALVPPLTVVGIALQAGAFTLAAGATLLFATNVTSILIAGAVVFVLTGVVPARRLSEPSARRTVRMVAMVLFIPIIGGLVISGQRLIIADTEQVLARSAAAAWLAVETPDLRLDAVTVDGQVVVVEVTGTVDELPAVEPLAGAVSSAMGRGVDVRMEITPRVILESGVRQGEPVPPDEEGP